MNLALKYRPQQFNEVVGQRAVSVILNAMINKDKLSQVLLFTGPSGVGKTTMARIVAAELNSDNKEDVHKGTHPSVVEIDGASNGNVEAIRSLKRDLNFSVAGRRVIIIDEMHAMSDEAKTALLNILEFPPKNVTFILITTEAHRIPVTIRHRADRYKFKKASIEDLLEKLLHVNSAEGFGVSDNLLNLIAQRSEGSYRESLMMLEQIATAEIKTVEEYNELHGEADFGPILISSTLLGPNDAVSMLENFLRYTTAEEISDRVVETLKDVMLLKAGAALTHTGEALESRIVLAKKMDSAQILKAIKIMWDLQTKLSSADPVRGLEMAFSLMGEVLQTIKEPSVQTNTLNLQRMKNYASK